MTDPGTGTATTAFYHHERCLWHANPGLFSLFLPVGGPVQPPAGAGLADSPESKRRILSLIQVSALAHELVFDSASMASEEDLLRVHPQSYLKAFRELSDNQGGELGFIAPFGPGSYEIARLATGMAIDAVDAVMTGKYRNAYVLARPGGHHCLPDTPMGFCLLANVAIAVETAIARHGLKRVAILDWDVHHGNGTQHIFYGRDDVLTISLHQEGCFPPGYSGADERGSGKGEGFNINVPLLPGGGHDAYLYAMDKIVQPAMERFKPELIVVSSGLDANGVDPLARMLAWSETYREMTERVMDIARRHCNEKLVLVHEGGYSETYVPFCGLAIMEALSGKNSGVEDPSSEMMRAWQPNERHLGLQQTLIDEQAAQIF